MKRNITLVLISVLIMLGLPLLAVAFVPGEDAMAVCFLLFFAVNPVYSVIVGICAGKDIRKYWFQPLLTALLFLAGVWLFFDSSEMAFLLYAGVYLLLGVAVMALSAFFQSKRT